MVLTFLAGFAAVFGTSEGIRASQSKSRREEHRSRKNNLVVHCPRGSKYSSLLEGRRIVLAGDKLYVDTGTEYNVPFGHPFEGYYLPYPAQRYSGLVSTITHEAPIMNWVFVHKDTYEIKFGNRQASEGNLTGPWDCTRQDRRLTFGGWEGFAAVREGNFWALYFDRDGDRLKDKVEPGTPVIELELLRREMRAPKPVIVQQPELTEEQLKLAQEQAALQAQQQAEEAARLAAQEKMLREALLRAQEEAERKEKEAAAQGEKQQEGSEAQKRNGEQNQQQKPQYQNGGKQKEPQSPKSPSQNGQRQRNGQNKNRKRRPSINVPLSSPNSLAAPGGANGTNGTNGASGGNKTSSVRGRSGSRSPNGLPNRNGPNGEVRENGMDGRTDAKDIDGGSDTSSSRSSNGRKRRPRRRPRRKNGVSSSSPEPVAPGVDQAYGGLQTPPSSIYPSEEELPPSPPVD